MDEMTSILDQLDYASMKWWISFPLLRSGSRYPAATRLSCYGADCAWGLVVEVLGFSNLTERHGCIAAQVHVYANEKHPPTDPYSYCASDLRVTADGEGPPLFDPEDILGQRINPAAVDMRIRGRVVPVTTNPSDYEAAGIPLEEPPDIYGQELLRWLAPRHRDLLLATEEEIAERLGRRMPLILRLDEWHHCDPMLGERPSQCETFQMLAEVLATGDPSRYRPTEPPNTHWSNWPMAGTI